MARSISLLKTRNKTDYLRQDQTSFRCNECEAAFQQPILASLSSSGSIQKYYACPRCLNEVNRVEEQKNKETAEEKAIMNDVKKSIEESEEDVECKHYFGYLKKRSKDTPIPEECLTCIKMIKCLLH
jgi:DNA-directed RNA polymerase subunit RPC12/RpoP